VGNLQVLDQRPQPSERPEGWDQCDGPFFPLGIVLANPGAIAFMDVVRIDPAQLLKRDQSGDRDDI
jgi:hypothetical protein